MGKYEFTKRSVASLISNCILWPLMVGRNKSGVGLTKGLSLDLDLKLRFCLKIRLSLVSWT